MLGLAASHSIDQPQARARDLADSLAHQVGKAVYSQPCPKSSFSCFLCTFHLASFRFEAIASTPRRLNTPPSRTTASQKTGFRNNDVLGVGKE